MRTTLTYLNVALRAVVELGIVCGIGYWGYREGRTTGTKLLLGMGAPLVGFGLWGLVDFRRVGAAAEWLRLAEELVISGLAAAAWYVAGQRQLAWALALGSVAHHALVYALGGGLLRH